MGKLAIETRGLKKSFGKTHAVAGVDLAVSAGGVYGVLGPNGAGKTTTIRMPLPRALGRNQLRQPGPLGQRHHRYQARNSRNRPEVQVTEGAAHVTQSWSTCSDGDDHASRNGEKQ